MSHWKIDHPEYFVIVKTDLFSPEAVATKWVELYADKVEVFKASEKQVRLYEIDFEVQDLDTAIMEVGG